MAKQLRRCSLVRSERVSDCKKRSEEGKVLETFSDLQEICLKTWSKWWRPFLKNTHTRFTCSWGIHRPPGLECALGIPALGTDTEVQKKKRFKTNIFFLKRKKVRKFQHKRNVDAYKLFDLGNLITQRKQDQKYSIMSPGFVTRSVLTLSHLKRQLLRLLKARSASPNPGFSTQHLGHLGSDHNYLCAIGTHLSQRLCMGEGNISFHKSEQWKTPYHWEAESFCLIREVQCQDCPGSVVGRHRPRRPPRTTRRTTVKGTSHINSFCNTF